MGRLLLILAMCAGCSRSEPQDGRASALVLVDAHGQTSISAFETVSLQISMVAPDLSTGTVQLSAAGGLLRTGTGSEPATPIVSFAWTGEVLLGRPSLKVDPFADPTVIELSASLDDVQIDTLGDVRFEVDADASIVHVDGEPIHVTRDWSAGLYVDFSAELAYRADDFPYASEEDYVQDNEPSSLLILEPPFQPGLAIAAGRRVMEIRHPDRSFIEHDYTPAMVDSGGPDYISSIAFSPAGFDAGAPTVLLSATSNNGGDGVYEVDPFWTITRPRTYNNTRVTIADPYGLFDSTGISDHYVGVNADIRRESDNAVLAAGRVYSGYVATNGDLIMMISDTVVDRVVRLESGTHLTTELATANESLELPGVTPHGTQPPLLLLLRDNREIGTVDPTGMWVTLLETLEPDWSWTSIALAMPGSPLADGGPALYVVSSNRILDRDRVLRFELP